MAEERKGRVLEENNEKKENIQGTIKEQRSLETVQVIKQRHFQKQINHSQKNNNTVNEKNRPYFSIVIPCYNSNENLGLLLQSIVQQNLSKEELEVILVDDCSTINYDNIIFPFLQQLNIKCYRTDYNYCPGNTRQKGVDKATGEWVIFADHDDLFEPDVFTKVRNIIEKEKDAVLCVTAFRHVDEKDVNKTIEQYVPSQGYGWTHGKFFNMDHFWKKYNFYYPKDLESHEDIAITSQCICILEEHPDLKVIYTDGFNTYRWIAHSKSTSNKIYTYRDDPTPRPFIDVFLIDYLRATFQVYLEAFKKGQIRYSIAQSLILSALLFGYFYQQGNIFKNSNYIKENYDTFSKYLKEIKAYLGMGIIDIYNYFKYSPQNLAAYHRVNLQSFNATGITIYEHTFKDWLEMIANGNY